MRTLERSDKFGVFGIGGNCYIMVFVGTLVFLFNSTVKFPYLANMLQLLQSLDVGRR